MATLGFAIPILEILVVLNLIVFLNVLSSFETKKSNEDEKKLENLIYRKNARESKQKIKLNFKIISEKPNMISR
jgi:high-affinity nickel permease